MKDDEMKKDNGQNLIYRNSKHQEEIIVTYSLISMVNDGEEKQKKSLHSYYC